MPTDTSHSDQIFQRSSIFRTTIEAMIGFHNAPDVLRTLTPLPLFVQVVHDGRVSLTEGEVVFNLWIGPVRIPWTASHEPGPVETSFVDRMLAGPMASWKHQHIFQEVAGGIKLTDKITYQHKPGWRGLLTRLVFDGLPLRFLFWYRHRQTRRILEKGQSA